MTARTLAARTRGFTLVEMVMAIVVISVGLGAVLMMFNQSAATSADPLLLAQARATAHGYLEEILSREFADPDADVGENRATFDDVMDYDGLSLNGCLTTSAACPVLGDCACNQFGDPIDLLSGFAVSVSVNADTLNGVPALRADVRVRRGAAGRIDVLLSGYRTQY